MEKNTCYLNTTRYRRSQKPVRGKYIFMEGEQFYKISNYDRTPPFFMSIVSDSDQWMFISSTGGLTAGRRNPDNAIFPYYPDDRIHDASQVTGSRTIVFVTLNDRCFLWEPFSNLYTGVYNIERNLYKNVCGNKLLFEEINHDLSLIFQYAWLMSGKYGFIRKSTLINQNAASITVRVLDGIQNILPYGISKRFQSEYSTYADAYKKNELDAATGMGIFTVASLPVDKAEPSEALKATIVWATISHCPKLLSSRQINAFRNGLKIKQETDVHGERGAYFINHLLELAPAFQETWYISIDIGKDISDTIALSTMIKTHSQLEDELENDIYKSTENLVRIVSKADGLQATNNLSACTRHFSNVLFNVMRGGVFDDDFIRKKDFVTFLQNADKGRAEKYARLFATFEENLSLDTLLHAMAVPTDPNLEKLSYEYLPLTFSRRHGDPSRPWNDFSIDVQDENGEKILNYQGNWRDIFQNWEALAISFPGYIESMIIKFVNGSTADGYNAGQIIKEGFEWDVLDPSDSWSYVGYWGDHQIIYLLKLLELCKKYHPGNLASFLTKNIFAYANVPYRIKPYADLLENPHETIEFDFKLQREIEERVRRYGADGKFVWDDRGEIYFVNLAEKLLVPLLAKLSNFIPEAGIWMNTQRPEWNDANNALVGYGVSMVTLYYLRRYITFCLDLFSTFDRETIQISSEVTELLAQTNQILCNHADVLNNVMTDAVRKDILDCLGIAGSEFRWRIYESGFAGKKSNLAVADMIHFFQITQKYLDHSISANRREDHLFHAYNLIKFEKDKISIRRLYEMLEGQVAVLSSGYLSASDTVQLLDGLRKSALYRKDQHSYILYPNRRLPSFFEKNNIPEEGFRKSKLLQELVKSGDRRIVIKDIHGGVHFNPAFRNSGELKQALKNLKRIRLKNFEKESKLVLDIYEKIFDHQSFTGRSGSFYKYEGLGCVYWHMVSKLLLVVQEACFKAAAEGENYSIKEKLKRYYNDIRDGLGFNKSPKQYGAFPSDPYSHTPEHIGAQQPGMTGQVKEDILTRFGELGLCVESGRIHFRPFLLKRSEFLKRGMIFHYYDLYGNQKFIPVTKNSLAFTYCQIPIIYRLSDVNKIILEKRDDSRFEIPALIMDEQNSALIFNRTGEIDCVYAHLTSEEIDMTDD